MNEGQLPTNRLHHINWDAQDALGRVQPTMCVCVYQCVCVCEERHIHTSEADSYPLSIDA